ncbi:hypothetical protein EDD22DRAFT_782939, partial [Suillus occidentalis]
EFAFLSACYATVGNNSSPDEAIHLAAVMQFAGFRSVIGSMWTVDDDVARQAVSVFYEHLIDGSGRFELHARCGSVAQGYKSVRKKIPLEPQIVFVHIGI